MEYLVAGSGHIASKSPLKEKVHGYAYIFSDLCKYVLDQYNIIIT
jgi:hypothetical protein